MAQSTAQSSIQDIVGGDIPVQDSTSELPVPPPVSADALNAALQDVMAGAKESKVKAEARAAKTSELAGIISGALEEEAGATQVIAKQAGIADLQAQNRTIEMYQAMGGHDYQLKLARDIKAQNDRERELLAKRSDIMDDEHTGIGIIDEIINEFRVDGTERDLTSLSMEQKATQRHATNLSANLDAAARDAMLTKHTINSGTIQAQQTQLAAQATKEAAEWGLKNAHSNALAFSASLAASETVAKAQGQIYEQENRQRMLSVQIPQAEMNLKTSKLAFQKSSALAASDIAKGKTVNAETVRRVEAATAAREEQVVAVQRAQERYNQGSMESKEIIEKGLDAPHGSDMFKRYSTLYAQGVNPDPVTGNINLADDPYGFFKSTNTIYPEGGIADTKYTRLHTEIQIELGKQFQEQLDKGVISRIPKEKDIPAEVYNAVADKVQATKMAEITPDSPYAAPPIATLAPAWEARGIKLWDEVLASKGMEETIPQDIWDGLVVAVQAKQLTPEQAAKDLESMFEIATHANNTDKGGFRNVGLAHQTTYNVRLQRDKTAGDTGVGTALKSAAALFGPIAYTGLGRGDGKADFIIDFTDYSMVLNALTRTLNQSVLTRAPTTTNLATGPRDPAGE